MKRFNISLLVILLVGSLLRFFGISFGLPHRYHPDEPQHVVEAAKMLAELRIEPELFNNPPFYKYLLMAGDAGYFAGSILFGRFDSAGDFIDSIAFDPSPLYFIGRLISAFFGTLSILVTYFIGKNAYNPRTGLLAAWFLAVTFLHVRDSHYAVNDALLAFLVTVSLLGSVLILRSGARLGYFLGTVGAGLAFATKYTAVFALIPLVYAFWFSPEHAESSSARDKLGGLGRILLLTALFALMGSPYFILKPAKVYNDIVHSIYSYGNYGFEGWQIDRIGGYLYYLKTLWWGVGVLLLICIFTGLIIAVSRRQRIDLLLLSFPFILYLFMGRQQMYFARFILPIFAPLLLIAARALEVVMRQVSGRIQGFQSASMFQPFLMVLLPLVVSIQPLVNSMRYDYLLTQKDTRTIAKEWVEANIPGGARIAVDWPHHSPALSSPEEPEPNSVRQYDLMTVGGHGLSDHPLSYYYQEGFEYLITSSNIYNLSLADRKHDHDRNEFYAKLPAQLELIYEIKPFRGETQPPFVFDEVTGPIVSLWQRERPGPTVRIFQLVSQNEERAHEGRSQR